MISVLWAVQVSRPELLPCPQEITARIEDGERARFLHAGSR